MLSRVNTDINDTLFILWLISILWDFPFNASSDLPLFESLETIDFSVFYDAANVWGVDYSSTLDDSSTVRSSVGLGIDWYTPIGPLSFSFTQPISKKSTDKTETFRFNLGTTF